MPDVIEEKISRVLAGQSVNEDDDLCDFTLVAQNEAIGNRIFIFLSPSIITQTCGLIGSIVRYFSSVNP